jgi:hypothetical protein
MGNAEKSHAEQGQSSIGGFTCDNGGESVKMDCATRVLDRYDRENTRIGCWIARPVPLSAFTAPHRQRSRVANMVGSVVEILECLLLLNRNPEFAYRTPPVELQPLTHAESLAASNRASLERAQRAIRRIITTQPGNYWRFRQLQTSRSDRIDKLDVVKARWIYLNPARCWAVLHSTNPERASNRLPLNTLIYQSAGQMQGLVADLEGQVLINELADYQPCSLAEWSRLSSLASSEQLTELVQRLASSGLVALAE